MPAPTPMAATIAARTASAGLRHRPFDEGSSVTSIMDPHLKPRCHPCLASHNPMRKPSRPFLGHDQPVISCPELCIVGEMASVRQRQNQKLRYSVGWAIQSDTND